MHLLFFISFNEELKAVIIFYGNIIHLNRLYYSSKILIFLTPTPSMNLITRLLLDHVVRFLTIEPYPVWRLIVVFIHFNNLTRNIMTVQVQGVTKSKSK